MNILGQKQVKSHLDLLLTCSGEEEVVHLSLEGVVDLDIDVVAGGLLRLGLPQLLHGDHVVDHDRVRWVQQGVQSLWDLRKFHPVRLNKYNFTCWVKFHSVHLNKC